MSFEKTRVALAADRTVQSVAFVDVTDMIAKFVVLDDESLVTFVAQGQAKLNGASAMFAQFVLQRDDDATPAFAVLADTGAKGNFHHHNIVGLNDVFFPVYMEQTRKLAAGRYTVKFQGSSNSALMICTFNGTAANGAPFEMCVEVENNDALVSAGQDSRHIAGQF